MESLDPMAIKTTLPAKLATRLDNLRTDLENFVSDQRSERDEMSERWLDGDKAASHESWLDALDELVATLADEIPEFDNY